MNVQIVYVYVITLFHELPSTLGFVAGWYDHELSFDNKTCIQADQSFVTRALSKRQCAYICSHNANCRSFSFSTLTLECTGCVPGMLQPCCTQDSPGTLYHTLGYAPASGERVDEVDCYTIKQNNQSATSGIYRITIANGFWNYFLCDMDTLGGGWTVFQYRYNGIENFAKPYVHYRSGFGVVSGEFWMGLNWLHIMAPEGSESGVYMYFEDVHGNSKVERASTFYVTEAMCYEVHFEHGDSALTSQSGSCFSVSNSGPQRTCARDFKSGWWFNLDCTVVNPNGEYCNPGSSNPSGLIHRAWKGTECLAVSKLMFRKRGEV